jgi:hypothetical protein
MAKCKNMCFERNPETIADILMCSELDSEDITTALIGLSKIVDLIESRITALEEFESRITALETRLTLLGKDVQGMYNQVINKTN